MCGFTNTDTMLLNELFDITEEKEYGIEFEESFEKHYGYFPDESDYRIEKQIEDYKKVWNNN